MRIYFEKYYYRENLIKPYIADLSSKLKLSNDKSKCCIERIGYLYVSGKNSGPVFILPNSFLIAESKDVFNVLGLQGVYPEDVIDTDDFENPLNLQGFGSFLPELGLWLFRSIKRFKEDYIDSEIADKAQLDPQLPDDGARDKDFLSTALELIDFLKDNRNIFTQISLINHSGRSKIDWPKTVKGDPFYTDGEPWYLDPAIKEKSIDIDDTLIRLYFSVLKYLRDKYKFPINLENVLYDLYTTSEIQKFIDEGIGQKLLKRIRSKYNRDDLKYLWQLLDTFFDNNSSNDDKEKIKEQLLVKHYNIVFEKMIDKLFSDDNKDIEALKNQEDGKLIDHIFRFSSLLGKENDIYYIGDSKYYKDDTRPNGTALYKQYTYAKNAIQYIIDNYYLTNQDKKGNLLILDENCTEGYNITPNFFIRSRVTDKDIDFEKPSLQLTYWNEGKHQQYPQSNRHYKDRLFDRDTLPLREFSINLLFVIAAYAGYEESYWASDIHKTIRNEFILSIDNEYEFYIVTPEILTTNEFYNLHYEFLKGKAFSLPKYDKSFILAYEKSPIGAEDKAKFTSAHLRSNITGAEVLYTMTPTTLKELNK